MWLVQSRAMLLLGRKSGCVRMGRRRGLKPNGTYIGLFGGFVFLPDMDLGHFLWACRG
jgi:hypothetical protein